ncbi:hypothetical protein [Nostoc sp.]|uniref:hypothetical protein n=1 Tax=Nostoc sp. TaxID=1180 RepID=UPI002FF95477
MSSFQGWVEPGNKALKVFWLKLTPMSIAVRDIMRESVIYQEIEAEAKAKGRAEGKAEGIRLVAANLLKSQMSLEEVTKLTGLSVEDVQLLQTEIIGN